MYVGPPNVSRAAKKIKTALAVLLEILKLFISFAIAVTPAKLLGYALALNIFL